LLKANIVFVMPVRLSARMEQLGFHWKDFHEVRYLNIFLNLCRQNLSCIKIEQE